MLISNHLPKIGTETIQEEIFNGLASEPKMISSKFFYSRKGSELFDEITQLDEYYPTRTEISILKRIAPDIAQYIEKRSVIELGSGDSKKISILFDAINSSEIKHLSYHPVDVSKSALKSTAHNMHIRYPGIEVKGIIADFLTQLNLVNTGKPAFMCFFGSTLGNFEYNQSVAVLKSAYKLMKPGDHFLLGLDRVKDQRILYKAYNDSKGVTAKFNLNILTTVNKLCGADFDSDQFEHQALYNEEKERIEMYLVSKEDQVISASSFPYAVRLQAGERIHTENSHKYSLEKIQNIINESGFNLTEIYSDENEWFSLVLMEK